MEKNAKETLNICAGNHILEFQTWLIGSWWFVCFEYGYLLKYINIVIKEESLLCCRTCLLKWFAFLKAPDTSFSVQACWLVTWNVQVDFLIYIFCFGCYWFYIFEYIFIILNQSHMWNGQLNELIKYIHKI